MLLAGRRLSSFLMLVLVDCTVRIGADKTTFNMWRMHAGASCMANQYHRIGCTQTHKVAFWPSELRFSHVAQTLCTAGEACARCGGGTKYMEALTQHLYVQLLRF